MWELTKSFRFEAAHALSGTTFGAVAEQIHGHSFRAEVTIRGQPDPATGMVVDLGVLDRRIADVSKAMGAFTVVRAASHEAAAKMFEDHPHFAIFPGETVEVMPVLPIPAG